MTPKERLEMASAIVDALHDVTHMNRIPTVDLVYDVITKHLDKPPTTLTAQALAGLRTELHKRIDTLSEDVEAADMKLEARIRALEDVQKSRPTEDVLGGIPDAKWRMMIEHVIDEYERTLATMGSLDGEIRIVKRFIREHVLKDGE